MPCLAANGKKMTAGEAMASGCPFVIDKKMDPYSKSEVHVSRTGEGGKRRKARKTRKSRKGRKGRKGTRRH
jgi:hypothetical protein